MRELRQELAILKATVQQVEHLMGEPMADACYPQEVQLWRAMLQESAKGVGELGR